MTDDPNVAQTLRLLLTTFAVLASLLFVLGFVFGFLLGRAAI